MTSAEFNKLLEKWVNQQMTETELSSFLSAVEHEHCRQLIADALDKDLASGVYGNITSAEQRKAAYELLLQQINNNTQEISSPAVHRVHFLKTSWFRYAAAVVLIAGAAAVWYKILNRVQHDGKGSVVRDDGRGGDIAPGSEKAVLTLADGSTIILDNATNGNVAQQGGTKIIKLDNGQLAYKILSRAEDDVLRRPPELVSGSVLYNTISTPRGGQYQITLPDGSKVYLNSASSIKFPAAFATAERNVIITGEAYIEVARNKRQPFIVNANGTMVRVLGTSFNINAYSDEEAVKTTLVEGSVKVRAADKEIGLKPGQQAVVAASGRGIKIEENPDMDKALAWKNGLFNFENASLKDVMKQLERWYDIDVIYENGIPDIHFIGEMSRNVKLSDLLTALQGSGVRFRLEERKLIVMP